ncbi:MAG: glutathione S-transferase family protein [Pseudomonadota bacterium]
MTGIILHHYEASPFSQKVRCFLGLKGLAWSSVITPNMMPKPDLTPLTGGYRRAPVMQIGADVYCDTQVILAEIEAIAPQPPAATGPAWAVNFWADRLFFQTTVPVIFGELGDAVPQAFIEDREKLSGRPFDVAAMKAAAGVMRPQWRAHAAWIDRGLAAQPFLSGETPGLADVAAYMNVVWLDRALPATAASLTAGLTRLPAWRERMAALGEGVRTEMAPHVALEIARDTRPRIPPAHDPADPLGLAPGTHVTVMADDYGRDPIAGALVAATPDRLVIARDSAELGALHIHFPRAGYIAVRAKPI